MEQQDVQGIPNVAGLDVLVSDDGGQSPDPSTQQSAGQQTQINKGQQQVQGTPKPEQSNLAQFKTPEDLLKSYKEVQGAFTRTSQENKALKDAATCSAAAASASTKGF
jgi:Tfp pilus assembly protein PilV